MTLEEKRNEYQKMIAMEFKKNHMEETEGLSLDEIALITPLTEFDFKVFLVNELMRINLSIADIQADIDYNLKKINNPKTFHQDVSECRIENAYLKRKIQDLRKKYEDLRKLIPEREEKDERSR